MIAAITMLLGALVWGCGEGYAIYSHEGTTSHYVKNASKRSVGVRFLIVVFATALTLHFEGVFY